ncbi:hypothetical protein DFH27DRAFT_134174 [Peziza echinospora]|nr:hypothetical protein DFH27DRAFT_134174 [Peziza echinospora]
MSKPTAEAPPPLPPPTIYTVPDAPLYKRYEKPTVNDPPPSDHEAAIVIDNGSWQLRAGYSTDLNPRLSCTPQVARYRDRKALKTYTICGNDVFADQASRSQAKSPFDGSVVSNYDVFENLLDYTFLKLGVDGDGSGGIGRPVVMTEAVCNPNYSRRVVSEMLFEAYLAPSVTYGIDALFSYSHNKGSTGLVISSSNTSTHIIPVINGQGHIPLATRLNWGSTQSSEYLLKLLQLKYPAFPSKLANWQAEALMVDHCYVSDDYRSEVSTYLDPDVLIHKDRIIQFPFIETVVTVKSEEELARIAERKKESGRRLQEQAAKMRLEKLAKKEQELEQLRDIQLKGPGESKRDFRRMLDSHDLKDEAALEKAIKELDKTVKRAKKLDVEEEDETPTFPLLEIPDEELDEAQIKQKKTQRLMKSNWDARQRLKAEKERERERIAEQERRDEEMRTNDLEGWIRERRAQREALLNKIQARARLKADLTNRKSLASQMRMKSLANLASDFPSSSRRRTGGAANNQEADDNFGANDDDWAVYRSLGTGDAAPASTADIKESLPIPHIPGISSAGAGGAGGGAGGAAGGGAGDGDDELSEDQILANQVKTLEHILLKHDPDFQEHLIRESQGDWESSRIHHFLRGCRPFNPDQNQAELHQLHLNVERIRVPEVVFQPAMAGLDQAGLIEICSDILLRRAGSSVPGWDVQKVVQDVFLTGGNSLFQGFPERVQKDLQMVLEWGSPLAVRRAQDPLADAWRGAAGWVRDSSTSGEWRRSKVTRAEYLEMGGDYIKEHRLGNANTTF